MIEIIVAKTAGFCFGVKRAEKIVYKKKESKKKVYTYGPLIHNPQAIEKYSKENISIEENLHNLSKDDSIIIRSHGVPQNIVNYLKESEIDFEDATCPFVTKVQNIVKELYSDGFQVIIFGDKNHPEVIGINDRSENQAIIIKNLEELKELHESKKLKNKIGLVAQTTQSYEIFNKIVDFLEKKSYILKSFNTICNSTHERQMEIEDLAKKVDLMLVLGGKNSANTTKLYKICSQLKKSFHIETEDEINKEMFENVAKVGISAGASTPEWIIKKVIDKINKLTQEN